MYQSICFLTYQMTEQLGTLLTKINVLLLYFFLYCILRFSGI